MYESKIEEPSIDRLFEALAVLESREDYYRFFEDISTIAELKAMAQRLEVVRMLNEERTYIEIAQSTGASTATISRVKKCLNYGADGYKLVLKRLKEKQS